MPISKRPTIEYAKLKLFDEPDVKIRTINSKDNLHCLRWVTDTWTHKYNGNMFKECEHGVGTYTWNETRNKTVYEGKFYANNLQGYGRVSYDDGSIFEGLFKMNLRFGPGIFTYCNGEQDVGVWNARYLIRLSQVVYPEWVCKLGSTVLGKAKMLRYRKIVTIERNIETKNYSNNNDQSFSIYSDCVRDVNSTFFNKPQFDDKFINKNAFYIDIINPENYTKVKVDNHGVSLIGNDKKVPNKTNKIEINKLVAWNNNEVLIQILLFTFLNREMETELTINIRKILAGDRSVFRPPGLLEQNSVTYLKYCSEGNVKHLERLIYEWHVHPNVCDAKGNSGIVYGASRDRHNVIKMLCNLGVDFNQFNDESLTALNISLLRYISKLNKINDWEVAFILPLICYPSQLDTEQLFETNSYESIARANLINNPNKSPTASHDKNLTSILHWTKSETKLLENYNYMNLRVQYDRVTIGNNCIFVFVPVINVKRPYLDEKLTTNDRPKRKSPKTRRRCNKKRMPSPTNDAEILKTSGVENLTNVSWYSDLQKTSLEDIEETVLLLLKGGSNPEKCSVPLDSIFLGVVTLNSNIVEALLKCKADPNSRSSECIGFLTPLHFVMSLKLCRELLNITKLLLEYGADPNLRASSDHWSVLKSDIQHPHIPDDKMGMTSLHLLCIRHDLDDDISGYSFTLAKLLLMYKANPNMLYMGHTALSLAMINGKKGMVKALLETKMVDPNLKLATEIGVPLTLFLNSPYLEFLPIEVCISIMSLITEYGANPLNMVGDDINALEFVRINKSLSRRPSEIWPISAMKFKSHIRKKHLNTTSTVEGIVNDNKYEIEMRRVNFFYALESHLHELTNTVMENYIFGIVVRQIYNLIDNQLDDEVLKYLKNISKKIEIPNFEKTTEIFGKMADANFNLNKNKVGATLEFTLYRDYAETERIGDDVSKQDSGSHTIQQKNLHPGSQKNTSAQGSYKNRMYAKESTKEQSIDDKSIHESKHNFDKLVDYITELSKNDSSVWDISSKFHLYYPEYDPVTYKYNICFECHRRKGVELLVCPSCEIVMFCSRKCNINNNARRTIHKCNTVFYCRMQTSGEYGEIPKTSGNSSERRSMDGPIPGKDKNISTQQKCEILGEAIDKYISFMLDIGGDIDFDKLIFPYCAYRDGNLYYRIFGENCFIENYSLV